MKKEIHPKVNTDTKVTCACGNSFDTMSTLDEIRVEICSACHPFFTGQQRFVDTEGRIEKFEKKRKMAEENKKTAKSTNKASKSAKKSVKPKTLKDLLVEVTEEK